jgi:hypothetical protein
MNTDYKETNIAWNTMPMCQPQTELIAGTDETDFEVVRVPGGWIVTRERYDLENDCKVTYSNSVFVPEPG